MRKRRGRFRRGPGLESTSRRAPDFATRPTDVQARVAIDGHQRRQAVVRTGIETSAHFGLGFGTDTDVQANVAAIIDAGFWAGVSLRTSPFDGWPLARQVFVG